MSCLSMVLWGGWLIRCITRELYTELSVVFFRYFLERDDFLLGFVKICSVFFMDLKFCFLFCFVGMARHLFHGEDIKCIAQPTS